MGNNLLTSGGLSFQIEKQMMHSFVNNGNVRPAEKHIGATKKDNGRNEGNSSETSAEQTLLQRIQKLESLLHLYSDLYEHSGKGHTIDAVAQISGADFFNNYYYLNRPVILKSMMNEWPALKKWSPDYFLHEFGHVPVEITRGRESDRSYEKNFRKTVSIILFGEFIKEITQIAATNDIYLVARNYFFSNPEFSSLRNDIIPPAEIIDISYSGLQNMKMWFGPGGTITPLHHDKHSILFCQVSGRKHFKMIPSFDLPYIYNRDRYYSDLDPENIDLKKHPLFLKASVADVIINPGDMLLIPAGWWHWVKSLDISISVTFSSFRVKGYNTVWNCK